MPTCEVCPNNAYYGHETPQFCRAHQKAGMRNVVAQLCAHEGCTSTSRAFGYPGQKGTHCKKHAPFGMVNVANPVCEHPDCTSTSRVFDFPGGEGRFCKAHALSSMVNVSSARCEYAGCTVASRNFDVPGGKGRFCQHHREKGMVDVRNHPCEHDGCQTRAGYSFKGQPARFCAAHKIPGMCGRYTCIAEDCKVYASYNVPGETTAIYCATHKLDGMINLRIKRCHSVGCGKCASFGHTTLQFCKAHAEDGMQNLIATFCAYPECDVQASYNHSGQRPEFCQAHSEVGMVCVIGRGCEAVGCTSRSRYYDVPGGKGRFCTKHREPGMVDVSNPKCEECDSLASYGIPGNKRTRCTKHRTPGMITRPKAKCAVCRKPAFYGTNFVPRHCELHKTEDDENLVERECVSCHLVMVLDAKNQCEYCNPARFTTNRLAKQNALMEYLNRRGLKGNSTDIVIDRGTCGRERPDRAFDFDDKLVILECDEHQHQDRDPLCEDTRMVNISQSYGGMPVIFLRWNPDHYAATKPEPLSKRYKRVADLLCEIRDGLYATPHAMLSVAYMYYDGWDGTLEWKVLLPWETT
jgi:hypothetical protein